VTATKEFAAGQQRERLNQKKEREKEKYVKKKKTEGAGVTPKRRKRSERGISNSGYGEKVIL